jgi:hypothetical protein
LFFAPLANGKELIWGEVTDFALREAAMRDGITEGLEKRAPLQSVSPNSRDVGERVI